MLDQLLKGYTFIFGIDDPKKEYDVPDGLFTYGNSFIFYRNIKGDEEKLGRIALDLRELGWKCGPKNPCSLDEFRTKLKPKDLDITNLTTSLGSFMPQIKAQAENCYGDIYNDNTTSKKALIICFKNSSDFNKLKKLFEKLNKNDILKQPSIIDPNEEKTFELSLTDGLTAFSTKTLTFKTDGVYDLSKLLFKYEYLEILKKKKCFVEHDLDLFPLKFLDNNLHNSKCMGKFRYNQIDTYITSKSPNCEGIIKYIATKMSTGCLKYINGEKNKYSIDLISKPKEGKWIGWSFYNKIGEEVSSELSKIEINLERITIYDSKMTIKQKIEYQNMDWDCNDFGQCNVWEYISYLKKTSNLLKLGKIQTSLKQIKYSWQLQDINFCFVIETAKDDFLICPRDISEEISIRTAVSVATDTKLIDADKNLFEPNPDNKTYFISKVTDSKPFLKDYTIKVKKENVVKLENFKETNPFLEYLNLKPIKNVQCAFEYRHLTLPKALHEVNPLCCARYKTSENNYICVQQQAKCYITLRRLIKSIRSHCLELLIKSNNSLPWSGLVTYNEIDNYKFKGEVNSKKGELKVKKNEIIITTKDVEVHNINLLSLKFICKSEYLCKPDEYERNQENFLVKNYDLEWQKSTFTKFWAANPKIKQKDCLIITSEDTEVEYSQMILVCTQKKGEGENLRKSITDAYIKKIEILEEKNYDMDKIPTAHENSEFEAIIFTTDPSGTQPTKASSNTIIKLMGDGLIYKNSGSSFIKYKDLIDNKTFKVSIMWDSDLKIIPFESLKGINPKTCFSFIDIGGLVNICMKTPRRAHYDKASLYKTLKNKTKILVGQLLKKIEKEKLFGNTNTEDSKDLRKSPKFKKNLNKYAINKLAEETFQLVNNGIWEGWVYEGSLTERDFKKVFNLVYCKISKGLITFQTDKHKDPYKTFRFYEYDQICPGNCRSDEYISASSKYRPNSDYDDNMYLDKTLNSYLGQMKDPYVHNACIVMDFLSPKYVYGQQQIFCTTDKTQGDNLREAIDILYYTVLLNLNIDKEVRKPNTFSDKYFARLIIDDKLVDDFNNFHLDNYGLIGYKTKEKMGNIQKLSYKKLNITYTQIDNDNFGQTCAFWYKNLKIKQKSEILRKIINDNNCCFRFYTKKDKVKIELCVFNPDNRICIKQSRELMKGLKMGCEEGNKSEKSKNFSPNHIEEENDPFKKNTIDDNENGKFTGFVYYNSALDSSQAQKANPYFIKISTNSFDFYNDQKNLKKSLSIPIENFIFSCDDLFSCSPGGFLKYAETNENYMSQVNKIRIVYNLFKDNYNLDDEKFEKNCFVLETFTGPILICGYLANHGIMVKKALTNAYKINLMKKKLTSVKEPKEGKSFDIILKNPIENKNIDIIFTSSGIVNKVNPTVVLVDYRKLDVDPVTKKTCAIWYNNLKPSEKDPSSTPAGDLLKKNCCFKFIIEGKFNYICVLTHNFCELDTFELIKSVWNGCKYDNPYPEQMEVSPDSEILGQKNYQPKIIFNPDKYNSEILPLNRNNFIFSKDQIKKKMFFDKYNEISFSRRRSLYHGWVNLYPLDLEENSKIKILKYYGRLSPENFAFYASSKEGEKTKLQIRPDMLSMGCENNMTCKPTEFVQKYLKKFNENYSYLEKLIKSTMNFYELRNEEGCSVLENFLNNKPKYFIICPRFTYHRSISKSMQTNFDGLNSHFISNRQLLSKTYGKILRETIYNAYLTSRKYTRTNSLIGLNKPIKQGKISNDGTTNEYSNIIINQNGVMGNSTQIINFEKIKNCMIQYNLVYVPEEMTKFTKNEYLGKKPQCCVRFLGENKPEYFCFGDLNCEYITYEFAYDFHAKCVINKKRPQDDLYNEMNVGRNQKIKPIVQDISNKVLKLENPNVFEDVDNISTDDNLLKQKSTVVKYLNEIRDIMHEVNKIQVLKSTKLITNVQETQMNDEKQVDLKEFKGKYSGTSKDWEVTVGMNRITKYRDLKGKTTVFVIMGNQYLVTNNYFAVIAEKSKYILIKYNDGKKMYLVEIGDDFVLKQKESELNADVIEKIKPALKIINVKLQ